MELRRRLLALFDASQDAGTDVGLGQGWRSSAEQERTFRARYDQAPCPADVRWDGKCWRLKPGMAPVAPPGRSYHEETTPAGFALAADLVGDIAWANSICAEFGLRHFADVNDEPWHHQPIEVPTSRTNYAGEALRSWALPGEDIDMLVLDYLPGEPGWIATLWTGETLGWVVNGHADAVLRAGGVRRVTVSKDQFAGVIASSATTTDPPAGMPADLRKSWQAQRRAS